MTNNRKKGIRIAGALFIIILLCALGFWTYRCLNPTREQVQAAKARIEAYSCYEIRRNGKTMLRFDEDTTTLAATFMNRWALVPSCQGQTVCWERKWIPSTVSTRIRNGKKANWHTISTPTA